MHLYFLIKTHTVLIYRSVSLIFELDVSKVIAVFLASTSEAQYKQQTKYSFCLWSVVTATS